MTYQPGPVPSQGVPAGLLNWLSNEFRRIAAALNGTTGVRLVPLGAEPDKPSEGLMVYADGASWDPGSGAGVYVYNGATWDKVS